jgi:hypothetical protein
MASVRTPHSRLRQKNALRYAAFCVFSLLVMSGAAFAEAYEQETLSKAYETRVRETLERHVPAKEFSVIVTATPNGKKLPSAPYVPKGSAAGAFSSLAIEELDLYVRSVKVEVLLSRRLSSSRRKIEEMITRSLKLRTNRGDKVAFSPLGIDLPSDEWERERGNLRQELNLAKAEAERLNRELQAAVLAKNAATSKSEGENKTRDLASESPSNLLYFIIGGLGILALVVMLWFARSLSKAGDNLSDAIATIGEAMAAANAVTQVTVGDQSKGTTTLESKTTIENKGGGGMAGLPMESLYAHLSKLREQVMDGYDAGAESTVVRHLTALLKNPSTAGRGVALMEFFGRDVARTLWGRIGLEAQEAIKRFQQEGTYDRSKVEMMMEAAEDIRTKLLMQSFEKAGGRPSDRVAEGIAQLSEDDLVVLVSEIKIDLIPRLFLYFKPEKIAFFLERLKRVSNDKFLAAVRLLPKMPEMTKVAEMDSEIAEALKNAISRSNADTERPFLKVYKEIVESASNDMREDIVKTLSANARIKSYFAENIITLATFFTLPEALRREITEGLSNKDYAALAAGASADERAELEALMPARRKELIIEELETFTARGEQAVTVAFTRSKDIVVARIRAMKSEGRLPKADTKKTSEPNKKVA